LDFDKINHNFTNSSHGHGRYLENGIKKNIDANFIKKLFNISLNSIYDIAKKFPDKKIVLITHHPICTDVIQKNWYDNKTVPACACNIGKEIVKNIPNLKLIVHGHVHQSHKYKIGKVPVICNPLGIIDLKTNNYENPEFDRNLIIEI
jgi:Icc-related predicted phosphoesterase